MKQFFLEKSFLFHTIFTVFIVYVLIVSHFTTAYGDNAPPFIFTLRQPDGVEFSARVFGNEWYHWVETLDGFTIRKNPVNGFWEYLERTVSGGLVFSGRRVLRDAPAGIEIHLRDLEQMRIAREKQSELFTEYLRKTGAGKVTVQGTGKPLVIMVDFTGGDHFPHKYSRSQFDDMLFSQGTYPTGSMNDYFREVSRGKYSVIGDVVDWNTAPQSYSYYCDKKAGRGDWPKNSQGLVYDIVTALDSQIDFSQYDTDGNGSVDGITLIVEGEYNQTNDNRFWAHMFGLGTAHRVQLDGVWINYYNIVNEQTPQGNMDAIGVFCHEWGHILGLPDLYDNTYVSEGIGNWGLMCAGNWNTPESPAHLCAWSKIQLGWINPVQITSNMLSLNIPSVNEHGVVYILWTDKLNTGEYFLIENRQTVGFDKNLKGTGLLIWHIDDNQYDNDNYIHKMVDLEEADGEDDLDRKNNRGDGGDPFPGIGGLKNPNIIFNYNSYPNSRGYSGNDSQVRITNISQSSSTMYTNIYIIVASGAEGTLKWSYGTWKVYSSPAIGSDGTIYVGSRNWALYAMNPYGTLKWSYTTGDYIESSPAIGADGTIYVGSDDNNLYAINPAGTLKWSYTTGDYIRSSPAIDSDGTVYVGSLDNKLYAINSAGTLKWSYTTGDRIWSSPAIGADGTIYVGSDDKKLYAINPAGTLKWSYTTGYRIYSSPSIGADGTVYVGSVDNKLYAINPAGTLKWSYTTGGYIYIESSPAIGSDGTIYVGAYDSTLYAINQDGTLKWRYKTGGRIESSPAIGSDGTIYIGSHDSTLYAINQDGTLKWRYKTGGGVDSSPAICLDGTIYVGSYDGNLYAINSLSMGLANSPWPKFRHDSQNTGRYGSVTGISENDFKILIHNSFSLEQNYPNPFNPQTNIKFILPSVSNVIIKIYDILGREVKTVISEQRGVGTYSVIWDGMNNNGQKVASGVYIYRMQAGSFTAAKRMVLIR